MQIKHQALAQHIKRKLSPLYLLTGQDNYLIEDSLNHIKKAIKETHDCDEKMLSIQSTEDWNNLIEEANSYSLFSDTVLLNVFFEKKTLDAAGKKILSEYLGAINSRCFIIIRAPNVPAKQLQWLSALDQALVVVAYPLSGDGMKAWIATQLKANAMQFDQQIPDLIYQYTQGNMLACAQVIEKIALTNKANSIISVTQALEHLSDQSEHSLFELVEACLMGQGEKAVQIVRQAANNKTESTLVLWMLTQEVRTLLQLLFFMQKGTDFKTACTQLKIWPQRLPLYQLCTKRLNTSTLKPLLQYCQIIDERIKTSLNTQVWNCLENIALTLALGHLVGEACAV